MAISNSSSAPHIPLGWSSQLRSAIRPCNMLQDIEVSAGYLFSLISIGRIMYVALAPWYGLL